MQAEPLSAQKAVRRGQLIATGAVYFIFIGVLVLSIFIATLVSAKVWAVFIGLIASFMIGWITWALIIPVWRLWALQRVDRKEIFALHRLAVSHQVEWPYGHLFFRAEIKSRKQARREAKYILASFADFLQDTIRVGFQWEDPIFRAYWNQVIL